MKFLQAVDWEVELAVVVGKKARNVSIENAYEYIFGYTVAQDISARDWQTPKRNNGQWLVGKEWNRSVQAFIFRIRLL